MALRGDGEQPTITHGITGWKKTPGKEKELSPIEKKRVTYDGFRIGPNHPGLDQGLSRQRGKISTNLRTVAKKVSIEWISEWELPKC